MVVIPDVVFGCAPTVLLVTLKVTVQLLVAGMKYELKLSAVWPAAIPERLPLMQVPPIAPPVALIFTSVSVKAAPVSIDGLLLESVRMTVDVPPS